MPHAAIAVDPEVTYVRRRCTAGRLSVELSSDANLFLEPQTVVAR